MDTEDIKAKLQDLRLLWKKFPDKRKIIEIQAKLLQRSLEIREHKSPLAQTSIL